MWHFASQGLGKSRILLVATELLLAAGGIGDGVAWAGHLAQFTLVSASCGAVWIGCTRRGRIAGLHACQADRGRLSGAGLSERPNSDRLEPYICFNNEGDGLRPPRCAPPRRMQIRYQHFCGAVFLLNGVPSHFPGT